MLYAKRTIERKRYEDLQNHQNIFIDCINLRRCFRRRPLFSGKYFKRCSQRCKKSSCNIWWQSIDPVIGSLNFIETIGLSNGGTSISKSSDARNFYISEFNQGSIIYVAYQTPSKTISHYFYPKTLYSSRNAMQFNLLGKRIGNHAFTSPSLFATSKPIVTSSFKGINLFSEINP